MQGLGNVGYHAAKFCREGGALIVAVAECDGDHPSTRAVSTSTRCTGISSRRERSADSPGPGTCRRPGGLELDCDVLIPAALENQITAENAPRIRARIIAEGANGPTTSDAERILLERGILLIPDIYLNAGGVTVSYFEWVKNLSHVRFGRIEKRYEEAAFERVLIAIEKATGRLLSPDEHRRIAHGADEIDLVNSGLEETMIGAYRQIRELMRQDARITDLRTAAFLNALRKVATSYMELGIFP